MAKIKLEELKRFVGTKVVEFDIVTEAPLGQMIITFNRNDKIPTNGNPIHPG